MVLDEIKKLLMVGVGATATTLEKTKEFIEEMVVKGELTVQQGKELNEELKHNIKEVFEQEEKKGDILDQLDGLSTEELDTLKAKIEAMTKENKNKKEIKEVNEQSNKK